MEKTEDKAVTNLRKYIRVRTDQPNPDYAMCGRFLEVLCSGYPQIVYRSHEVVAGKPFFIMTLYGQNCSLPSLMLYSHTDVVPAVAEAWSCDPFGGYKDSKKRIFGRGTQDMKSVGIQYLESLKRLINDGRADFLRTVHIVWGPDEEIGAVDGMSQFVDDVLFKELNVGFALDEGLASEDEVFKVYYGERCPWWLKIICKGQPGHGSRLLDNTAAEKFNRIISFMLEFREEQNKLKRSGTPEGNLISINLTKVEGGTLINIIPDQFIAWFDIRVPPNIDYEELEVQIKEWCSKAGTDVSYVFQLQTKNKNVTATDESSPWWNTFSSVLFEMNYPFSLEIFPGSTDSRFLRQKGIQAIGFSPINNTPVLLHDNDEYIDESVFLRGLDIYEKLISKLANVLETK